MTECAAFIERSHCRDTSQGLNKHLKIAHLWVKSLTPGTAQRNIYEYLLSSTMKAIKQFFVFKVVIINIE